MYQLSTLKTICESSEMSTAFSVASMTTPTRVHVCPDIDEFQGGINLGRLPVVLIKDLGINYELIAQPDYQLTRSGEFQVRMIVSNTLRTYQTKYEILQTAKVALIKKLLVSGLNPINFKEEPAKLVPFGLMMDLYFTSETSGDVSMTEI